MTQKDSTRDCWLNNYNSFNKSGLTQREYCRQEELGYWTFNSWKRRFDKSESDTTLQEVPIKISPAHSANSPIEIILENNLRISIPENFSENTLKKIISVMRDQK